MREKVGKSRNTVFPMICGSGGSKSRLAKAVVARSTFPSQNVQNTSISLLEVEMSKKCTSLWCEAHLEIKMEKKNMFGPLLDVQVLFRMAGARDYGPCQK